MYDASVCNAVSVWGNTVSCVGEMIQQGHILAALATLMYSSYKLHQVINIVGCGGGGGSVMCRRNDTARSYPGSLSHSHVLLIQTTSGN